MKHFQIIDGGIVFMVSDQQEVEREIREILSRRGCRAILAPGQEDTEGAFYMELVICSEDEELQMAFRADNPELVCEDGRQLHYWNLRPYYSTVTELYEEEDTGTRLDFTLEDLVMAELRDSDN